MPRVEVGMAAKLPSGTVTFLFTDIENSIAVVQAHPEAWESLRQRHVAVLRAAIEQNCGQIFQIVGDGCCAAFGTVSEAVSAAAQAQRTLQAEVQEETPIRVRMGIHTGEAQFQGDEYRGYLTLARVQRVMSAAHGEQILLSNASAEVLRQSPRGRYELRDLGELRLKGLLQAERVWQVEAEGLRHEFPPLESPASTPNNLPVELTSFFGRETEIEAVGKLLEGRRLVTLTGAGGVGKTRLALQVAAKVLEDFPQGVWFTELAPLSDPELIPNAVATALGVREAQDRPLITTVLDSIRGKRMLLVLDNCEHLLDACAKFADAFLRSSPGPRLLATSREALGIAGEAVFRVPSLAGPEVGKASPSLPEELIRYPAVQLFTERARDSLATFSLKSNNATAVAHICQRLDGIPLALELAAARVRLLSVEQIAERLNDRFGLLTAGGRTSLPRHQTLRALIDWSHDLLPEAERVLLRRLSVFAGGWTLEAAESVCAGDGVEHRQVLDLLGHLADKSLVSVEETSGERRYRLLETIRAYGRERLAESGEEAELRSRHLDYAMKFVEQAETNLHGLDERLWLDRLEADIDNIRAALEWAASLEDPEAGLLLAGSLYWFWWTRGYWQEANKWLREMLGRPGSDKPTKGRAAALIGMGWFLSMAGELDAARAMEAEAVRLSQELGDQKSLAQSLTMLGLVVGVTDTETADPMLERGLALARDLEYRQGILAGLVGLGNCRVLIGKDGEAQGYYEEAAERMREAGDKNQLAYVVRRLAYLALRRNEPREAMDMCTESLSLNEEMKDQRGIAACLAAIASIACEQREAGRAATLYGASAAIVESLGGLLIPEDCIDRDPFINATRAALDKDEYDRLYAEGMTMKLEDAVAYALERRPSQVSDAARGRQSSENSAGRGK